MNNESLADPKESFPIWLHYCVALFTFFVAVFSIFGNAVTFLVLQRHRTNNHQIKIYRMQLALSHIISPVASYWMLIVSSSNGYWAFGQIGCALYGFIQGLCALYSIVVAAAIALNRAISLKSATSSLLKNSIANSAALWIIAFALSSPPIFGWNRYTIEGLGTTCCFDLHANDLMSRTFVIYIFLFGFIIPLTIILFSYHRVCIILFKSIIFRQQSKILKYQASWEQSDTDQMIGVRTPVLLYNNGTLSWITEDMSLLSKFVIIWNDRHNFKSLLRSLRTMLIITVCFVCAWLPYATLAIVGQFASFPTIEPYLNAIAGIVAKSYVAFDPIIYFFTDETFRRRVYDMLHREKTVGSNIRVQVRSKADWSISPRTRRLAVREFRKINKGKAMSV